MITHHTPILIQKIVGQITLANPLEITQISDLEIAVETALGSKYLIRYNEETRLWETLMRVVEKPLNELGTMTRFVEISARWSLRRAIIEATKWELYKAIKKTLKMKVR